MWLSREEEDSGGRPEGNFMVKISSEGLCFGRMVF